MKSLLCNRPKPSYAPFTTGRMARMCSRAGGAAASDDLGAEGLPLGGVNGELRWGVALSVEHVQAGVLAAAEGRHRVVADVGVAADGAVVGLAQDGQPRL